MDTSFAYRSSALLHAPLRRFRPGLTALIALFMLAGCASGGGIGKAIDKTLEVVGIKEDVPEIPTEARVPLHLYAGENLNAGNDQRALALVVKIYHLRSSRRFEQATYETLLDEDRERSALGDDLLAVNEMVLTPGAREEIEEQLPAEAATLGVVALFRAPANGRWRLSFDPRHKTAQEGITLGLHACAITTSSEALTTQLPGDPASLASVRCMSP